MKWVETSLHRLRARVYGMVTRAVVATVNDALKVQRVQLTIRSEDEVGDSTEHFQPYGVSFMPAAGSEAIVLAVGGNPANRVAICIQHPEKRPKGAPAGTGGLYTEGEYRLFIDADGIVHVGPDAVTHLAAAFIARADLADARIATLQTAFDLHVHATAGTGTPSPPTLAAPVPGVTVPIGTLASVAATKGKVT
jgi:phage baseplate assembly protein V